MVIPQNMFAFTKQFWVSETRRNVCLKTLWENEKKNFGVLVCQHFFPVPTRCTTLSVTGLVVRDTRCDKKVLGPKCFRLPGNENVVITFRATPANFHFCASKFDS